MHAEDAAKKLRNFQLRSTSSLDVDESLILRVIEQHSGRTSSEVFALYQEGGGKQAYSSFQRKLKGLEKGKFVTLTDVNKGNAGGRTTLVEFGFKRSESG